MTETIRCPGCGAGDTSPADASGLHVCAWCGVRYRLRGTTPRRVGTEAGRPRDLRVAAFVVALLGLGGIGVAVGLSGGDAPSTRASDRATTAVTVTSEAPPPVAPATATSEAPPPVAPATATFTHTATHRASDGSTWVYGTVTNTSPYPIGKPEVLAVFLDAAGDEVGTDHGYARREQVLPGGTVPVTVLMRDPPTHASVRYEVVARALRHPREPVEGLVLEALPARRGDFSGWTLSGKVVHEGTRAARFVEVEIAALDADGRLVGLMSTYAKAERLEPGASARFTASLHVLAGEPSTFEYTVWASPAP